MTQFRTKASEWFRIANALYAHTLERLLFEILHCKTKVCNKICVRIIMRKGFKPIGVEINKKLNPKKKIKIKKWQTLFTFLCRSRQFFERCGCASIPQFLGRTESCAKAMNEWSPLRACFCFDLFLCFQHTYYKCYFKLRKQQ